jgi:hypothetical protein
MPAKFEPAIVSESTSPRSSLALRWSGIGLGAASWVSAAFFGMYTLTFYFGAIPSGHMDQWNIFVPGLYDKRNLAALLGIAAHFATGAIILILGPVQFIAELRARWPWIHRWLGRMYVSAALVTGLGGLGFIASKGTIDGAVMNIGFGLYGVLVLLAAIKTYQNARSRRWEEHRAWAIRLFALVIGSWLYRMEFGLWLNAVAPAPLGHLVNYRGRFDIVMSFFFYLPNLAVAELFLRAGRMVGAGDSPFFVGASGVTIAIERLPRIRSRASATARKPTWRSTPADRSGRLRCPPRIAWAGDGTHPRRCEFRHTSLPPSR